jgi:hypothetical protein
MNPLEYCPPALQDNKININNHLAAIQEAALGPPDPLKPNHAYWIAKSKIWGISEGDARGRLCNNCEYYYDTPTIRSCVANGPAKDIKASALPLTPKWADIEAQPIGYCEKWDITCSPIRTCDEQEIREREDAPVEYANPFETTIKSSLED